MEKKTIGAFIAALRRASGLTQRELAEKLNVSDKAVSRWEREESLPDLSLIPAIAEIFGVTADELLRGERMKPGESQPRAEEKSEKQLQNLVRRTVVSLSTRSLIAAGIALAGFIAALIADLAFSRGYIAFFAALAYYVVAALCQAGFLISALSALSVEDGGAAVENGRRSVLNRALWVFGLIITLFAATLPVVILPYNAYTGLAGDSWFEYGLLFGFSGLAVSMLIGWICNSAAIKRGFYSLDEKQTACRRLRVVCVFSTLLFLLLSFLGEELLTTVDLYAPKHVFNDYDSFVAFMAEENTVEYLDGYAAPPTAVTYYDKYGNAISRKEAARREIVNNKGETVLVYYQYNEQAVSVRHPGNDTCLPITVITQDGINLARRTVEKVEAGFIAVYILEILAGAAVYIVKSRRIKNQPA